MTKNLKGTLAKMISKVNSNMLTKSDAPLNTGTIRVDFLEALLPSHIQLTSDVHK